MLGDDYEKESVLLFMTEKQAEQSHTHSQYHYQLHIPLPDHTERIIDIEHNEKIKNSPAYAQWAKIHNLQIQAQQFAFLVENHMTADGRLEKEYDQITAVMEDVQREQRSLHSQIKTLDSQMRLLGQYFKLRKVWKAYCGCGKDENFYMNHQKELDQYHDVLEKINEAYADKKLPDLKQMKQQKNQLVDQKEQLTVEYKELKRRQTQIHNLIENGKSLKHYNGRNVLE